MIFFIQKAHNLDKQIGAVIVLTFTGTQLFRLIYNKLGYFQFTTKFLLHGQFRMLSLPLLLPLDLRGWKVFLSVLKSEGVGGILFTVIKSLHCLSLRCTSYASVDFIVFYSLLLMVEVVL